jgi:hypothetical protein
MLTTRPPKPSVVVVVVMAVVPNTNIAPLRLATIRDVKIPTQQSVCRIFRNGTSSRMAKVHQPTQETGTVGGLTFYRRQL